MRSRSKCSANAGSGAGPSGGAATVEPFDEFVEIETNQTDRAFRAEYCQENVRSRAATNASATNICRVAPTWCNPGRACHPPSGQVRHSWRPMPAASAHADATSTDRAKPCCASTCPLGCSSSASSTPCVEKLAQWSLDPRFDDSRVHRAPLLAISQARPPLAESTRPGRRSPLSGDDDGHKLARPLQPSVRCLQLHEGHRTHACPAVQTIAPFCRATPRACSHAIA